MGVAIASLPEYLSICVAREDILCACRAHLEARWNI